MNSKWLAYYIKAAWLTLQDDLSWLSSQCFVWTTYKFTHNVHWVLSNIYIWIPIIFCNSINGILSNIFYTDSIFFSVIFLAWNHLGTCGYFPPSLLRGSKQQYLGWSINDLSPLLSGQSPAPGPNREKKGWKQGWASSFSQPHCHFLNKPLSSFFLSHLFNLW